jgi:flagellar basal-body rod protein FlgF
MDTGVYVALSKETGIFRDMDVTANNIANMNTTGFQSEDLLFADFLTPTTKQENTIAFANDIATYRNTGQGTMQVTGASLDAAIEGKGYFAVQTPLGIRYTRNGNFKTNGGGTLVTSEGYTVLDEGNQPLNFDSSDRVIKIHEDGTVNVDGSDRVIIKVVQFDNEQLMHHVGNGLYTSDLPPKQVASNFTVVNGMLERSNVQPFLALTHMMYVSHEVTDTANFINTMYTLERNASNTLAKIYT